jgi:hypothetical protein
MSLIFIYLLLIGCLDNNLENDILNIEIIEYNVTAQKRVREGCCYKNIIIDNGFNYSYEVQFYVVKGTIINNNNNNNNNISINKLKIIGNFYDIDGNKIISRWDHISNVSYLTEKKFEIILRNHYAFPDFKKIALIKFEFEIID